MKIFLDTGNLEEIKKYVSWGVVDGVTTNPSLIAKEWVSFESRIKEILQVVDGPISAEVTATDADGMLKEARKYAKWHKNIVVKLPTTPEGLKALSVLSKEGIKTNMTLVFSVTQALLVAKAGATFVSPFLGRLDDIGERGVDLIEDIREVYDNYGFETEILSASIRNLNHIKEVAIAGTDIATIPPKLMDKMIQHNLTDRGLEKFLKDWEECEACKK